MSAGIGEQWEVDLAQKTGGNVVPGSGSRWHSKLDVRGRKTLWSAKATAAASFRVDHDMLRELRSSIATPGALGLDVVPILGVRLGNGEEVAVCLLDDFMTMMSAVNESFTPPPIRPRIRDNRPQIFRESHN